MQEMQINYGKHHISYELQRMQRKTLEIAVHPDKNVIVKAPLTASKNHIEKKITKRARWILKQIAYFSQFEPRTPPRQYVGGESHLYLGKKYRLKFIESQAERIALKNGYFYVESCDHSPDHAQKLLATWYLYKAEKLFPKLVKEKFDIFKKHELELPKLTIKTMKTRWGSYAAKGGLTLNTQLIMAPKECIEYVVTHELCHMLHYDHSKEFYSLLERVLPDWAKRKHKLEMTLV